MQYKYEFCARVFHISLSTFKRWIKDTNRHHNDFYDCHGIPHEFCKNFKKWFFTRKGKINGYRRAFAAFKIYCTKKKKSFHNWDLTEKQMRKIMSDHLLHGKNRNGKGYKKEERSTFKWKEEDDFIKGKFEGQNAISMDIKYVNTDEGTIYVNFVKDFVTHGILGAMASDTMTFKSVVEPSLMEAIENLKKLGRSTENLITHTDNGKQYWCKEYLEMAEDLNMIVSHKKPYRLGHNALSENTFYHLAVEWIPYDGYRTKSEAIKDIMDYVNFYNFERIHSHNMEPPLLKYEDVL